MTDSASTIVRPLYRIRFLTYNILDGGRGRERDLTDIICAQDADVILLQEVAAEPFVETLARALNAEWFIAASNSWRRVAILSRLPLKTVSSFHPRLLRHGMLKATIEYAPHRALAVFGIHLAAPAYTFLVELYRLRELTLILKRIAETRAPHVVLAGDLNSIAPGDRVDFSGVPPQVKWMVYLQGGMMARQAIGKVRRAGFTDCFRALYPDERGFTLPPDPPQVRLDYFFVNDALRQNVRACDVVTTPDAVKRASDHLPVKMELEL